MGLVAFDARDAHVPMPDGSGIYLRRRLDALSATVPDGIELCVADQSGRARTRGAVRAARAALRLRRRTPDLRRSPDSCLPRLRNCAGVLTVHDLTFLALDGDMLARTQAKYRALVLRAARGAERVVCPSQFTASDLERRYGVSASRIRVIPEAAALGTGSLAPPPGPYLLAAGDLRPNKNLEVLVQAFTALSAQGWRTG